MRPSDARRVLCLRRRDGAAVVEVAFVLPIFLMVVWGIVEFGRAMMVGQMVTNAARHGVRIAVIDGSTNDSVRTAVTEFLVSSLGIDATDVDVAIAVDPAPGNTDPADNLVSAQSKDLCQVRVAVPYDEVSYMAGQFLRGADLVGQCTMRHE